MRSTYLSLNIHIIFATKNRQPRIRPEWQLRLYRYLGGAIKGQKAQPLAIGGIDDHLHLLVGFRATHCLANFMRELKRQSSIWIHETIGDLGFNWQEGYSAFTVSPSNITASRNTSPTKRSIIAR